jgi:hypothetical protein
MAEGQEQDKPYEEAGLIEHDDDEDEDEQDVESLGQNPFEGEGEEQRRPGVSERISEEIDRRVSEIGKD